MAKISKITTEDGEIHFICGNIIKCLRAGVESTDFFVGQTAFPTDESENSFDLHKGEESAVRYGFITSAVVFGCHSDTESECGCDCDAVDCPADDDEDEED